jgi:mono/diheme cytochrome c family protein
MKNSLHRIALAAAAAAAIIASARLAQAAAYSPIANGRAIFQTGRDLNGVRITAKPPALMPYCAACHGASGAGGKKLPGGAVSADLRHSALITHQKHPYTLALLERAISTGIDNDGDRLNSVMPRWKLSKRDLHDVAEYVLTQLK